jgi:peptidoglycan/xylan/chitin deacetylase (PgdA/CDA1 family)
VRAIALLYHDVVEVGAFGASGFSDAGADTYKLHVDDFEQHLDALAAAAESGPLTAYDVLEGKATDAPWLLTFDDGGRSAYTHIAGRLERRGWRGHFLVTTDYIGAPTFVTREQVRELGARGHVVGSHSCSHPVRMSAWPPTRLREEWRTSIAALSDILGERVVVASVPAGSYSRAVAEAASHAGIRLLFNSEPTADCRYEDECLVVGRFSIRTHSPPALAARLVRSEVAPRLAQWLAWNTRKLAKTVGGPVYLRVRKTWLGG